MKVTVTEVRKAIWHFRKGGLPQLKRWNIQRLANTAVPNHRLSLILSDQNRSTELLKSRWSEASREIKLNKSRSQKDRVAQPFPQGWALFDPNIKTSDLVMNAWVCKEFGDLAIHHDPDLEFSSVSEIDQDFEVIILGQATDSKTSATNSKATIQLLQKVMRSDSTWKSFDDAVTWLGGRFVILARRGDELRVHVDAMASRSCYWGKSQEKVVLGSHSALVANLIGSLKAEEAQWVFSHPNYHNPAGKYLPGLIAPHDNTHLVFANCLLSINGQEINHQRFFFTPPAKLSVDEATKIFLDELRFQMSAALSWRPHAILALTNGADSKAILTATLDLLQDSSASAMTYHFFNRNAAHSRDDLLGANRLAEACSLPHRIMDVSHREDSFNFAKSYRETFPTWARFPSLARAYFDDFRADESVILGIGGEVGTVFYRDRDFSEITSEVLAGKFTQSDFKNDPKLLETMERYIQYTHLNDDRVEGYELLDLFYWEHRLSSWAAYGYSEADFGPLVVLPLNTRRIFHPMLSLPYKDRLQRSIYKQLEAWSNIK